MTQTENNTNSFNSTRVYGIDALKILSMIMVVILHILGHGNILFSKEITNINYNISWFLEICAYGAVNIFAIISGYLLVNKNFKFIRLLSLWLQVLFYSFFISVIFFAIFPYDINFKLILQSLFPVSFRYYWYFSSYFALSLMSPFFNKFLNILTKREYTTLVAIIIFLFSILSLLYDPFSISQGYSFIWLTFMYIIGGYIKKYGNNFNLSKKTLFFIYLASSAITWLSKITIKFLTLKFLNKEIGTDILISYISPTILIASISLVLLFTKIKFPHIINKAVSFLSPLSFGVYLIHEHPLFKEYLIINKFEAFADKNVFYLLFVIISSVILIYLFCTLIEFLRTKIFEYVKINILANKLATFLDNKIKLN